MWNAMRENQYFPFIQVKFLTNIDTKQNCKKCETVGVTCRGYVKPIKVFEGKRDSIILPKRRLPPLRKPTSPSNRLFENEHQFQCFNLFVQRTSKQLIMRCVLGILEQELGKWHPLHTPYFTTALLEDRRYVYLPGELREEIRIESFEMRVKRDEMKMKRDEIEK